ncbi:MAG TPA: cold shock domain-containing protein [Pirellulaceae bacterium]|nr:cold shock domain-containing protein [Pirellulaceae bacterium]
MLYGYIKNLSHDRGFGFIEPCSDGPDVYFHATTVGSQVFDGLQPGQPVRFEIQKLTEKEREARRKLTTKQAPRAAKVELLQRMPGGVLPRPTQDIAPRHHPKAKQRKATWKRKINLKPKE